MECIETMKPDFAAVIFLPTEQNIDLFVPTDYSFAAIGLIT